MTCHYRDEHAWRWRSADLLQPIRNTTQIWVMTPHQQMEFLCSLLRRHDNGWWRRDVDRMFKGNLHRLNKSWRQIAGGNIRNPRFSRAKLILLSIEANGYKDRLSSTFFPTHQHLGPLGILERILEFLSSFIIITICKLAFYHDCCNLLLSILFLEGH